MTLYNKIPADKIDPIGQAILNLYPHANIEGAVYPETNFRQVIVTDTFMYGFWGEGHTWPLESNPFPDSVTAENTFVNMFQHQQERWKKTRWSPIRSPTSVKWVILSCSIAPSGVSTGCGPTPSSLKTSRSRN